MDAAACAATTSGRVAAWGAARRRASPRGAAGAASEISVARTALALLAAPGRMRRAGRGEAAGVVCSFGAAAGWAGDTGSSFDSLSHLASFTGFALGALFVGREIVMEQEREQEPREMCETCQGTGRVPCLCQRWSDSDSGCGTCGNTGMMMCKDCTGGGTKVPVARVVPIYVKDETDRYRGGPYNCRPCSSGECSHSHEH